MSSWNRRVLCSSRSWCIKTRRLNEPQKIFILIMILANCSGTEKEGENLLLFSLCEMHLIISLLRILIREDFSSPWSFILNYYLLKRVVGFDSSIIFKWLLLYRSIYGYIICYRWYLYNSFFPLFFFFGACITLIKSSSRWNRTWFYAPDESKIFV